jgi:iron-sulfur cluster repair protein YtfE (RIC family)
MEGLQRHAALVPLSHDHHHGLVAAQRLKRAEPASRQAASLPESITLLWEKELAPHFDEEERLLFAPAREIPEATPMVERAIDEHQKMQKMVAAIGAEDLSEDRRREMAREFGRLLESHIRFEERELFPTIEKGLGEDRLLAIAPELAVRERTTGTGDASETGDVS